MASKRIQPEQLEAVQKALRSFVARFGGNQTEAAEALGVAQGTVSAVLGGNRGVGIDLVVRLADRLQRSTDGVLGLRDETADPELDAALRAQEWPEWLTDAAISRRNLKGPGWKKDQWLAWMRWMVAADGAAEQNVGITPTISKQEAAFDRKRAKAKRRA